MEGKIDFQQKGRPEKMFYSWKFCMKHDLSMIYRSPAPAFAHFIASSFLNHLLFLFFLPSPPRSSNGGDMQHNVLRCSSFVPGLKGS